MTLFLCGFMGCGKSALGRALSKRLELPLIDTDDYIVKTQGMSIPEIFEKYGEPYFREIEAKAIADLSQQEAVISCGGGAILNDKTAEIARENGICFHTDAVQAVGILDIDVEKQNIDSLSLSAHKFYGPKGIGVLYVKKNIKFEKFIDGGHQERNKRAGTENVANIVGLAKALEIATESLQAHKNKISSLRDYFESNLKSKIENATINGDIENRLPGNSNISFLGVNGQDLLLNLDMLGICVSSGSACTSGSIDPSHVLTAIGLDEEKAKSSIRISIGKYNTKEDIDYLIKNLVKIIKRQRDV